MKKIAYIFVLLTAAVLTVAGVEVEKFIPRQAPGIARIDINRMLTSPELKTVIEKNDKLKPLLDQVCEMFKDPTGQTVKSSDIFSGQLWIAQTGSSSREVTIYSQTAVKEADLQAAASRNPGCKTVNAADRKAYVYTRSGEAVAIVYLAEDVLLISRLSERLVQEITASLQGGGNPLLANIDRKDLVAVAADVAAATGKRKPKVKFVNGKLNLNKGLDLNCDLQLHCRNSKEALKQAMQIQFAVPGFIGMLFSKDEKLATTLSEGLQIIPQENVLNLNFAVKKDTLQQLVTYMSKPENRPVLP